MSASKKWKYLSLVLISTLSLIVFTLNVVNALPTNGQNKKGTSLTQNNPISHKEKAFKFYDQKKYSEALLEFNKAIEEAHDNNPALYILRGEAKEQLGDHTGAKQDFNKSLEKLPDNPAVIHDMCSYDVIDHVYDEALVDCELAVKKFPSVDNYYNLGVAKAISQPLQAVENFTKALELDPSLDYIYAGRARSRLILKDYSGAIEDSTNYINKRQDNHVVYSIRCIARFYLQDYSGTIDDCTKSIQLDSKQAIAYDFRGRARVLSKDYSGSLEDFEQAKTLYMQDGSMGSYQNLVNLINETKKMQNLY